MKIKDVMKQLVPGALVALILGLIINVILGVNAEDIIPNIIVGVLSCAIPTLISGIVVLERTAQSLKRDLTVDDALKRNGIYIFVSAVIGLFFMLGLINSGVILTDVDPTTNLVTLTSLGVVVSTMLGFFAIREYASDVKYTKRKKSEK